MSPPAPAAAAAAPALTRAKKTPWILGALLVLLGGGGYVGYARLAQKEGHGEPEKGQAALGHGVTELEPFVLNLADPSGDRYFRLNLRVVLDQKAIAERAQSGLAQAKLRDRILAVLSKKRASEVVTVEGKERLRAELSAAVEALLSDVPFHDEKTDPARAHVLEVFFTEFLVQ